MPYGLLKRMTNESDYVLAYFHPSDFDPGQPQMPQLPRMRQFKNRIALRVAYSKFEKYISNYSFQSIFDADKDVSWENCTLKLIE